MDATERRVRKFVLEHFLEHGSAPCLEEVAAGATIDRAAAALALRHLDDAHHLKLLDGTTRILMAFPFAALGTPYRVTRPSGRRYFANCAWDAIAFHVLLDEPIRVDSFCHHCGEPLSFPVGPETTAGATGHPLVQLALPAADWWKDITRTCANTMVFLSNAAHVTDPKIARAPEGHGVLSVAQMIELSRPIYTGKMRLEYDRPSSAVLEATFRRLGLSGPHWAL